MQSGPKKSRERLYDAATLVILMGGIAVAGLSAYERYVQPRLAARPVLVSDWRSYGEFGQRIGPRDAPVTIVYFRDYECPACRAMAPRLDSISSEFGDSVAIVHRHWPLSYHEAAYPAARAVECASLQENFESYDKLLYAESAWMDSLVELDSLAVRANMPDIESFLECNSGNAPVAAVERDIADIERLGGTGTPTLLINDRLLRVVPSRDELRSIVLAELEE